MLKVDVKRGYTTPASELLFAFAQMDFSNAEAGLMFSALPYMYGHPNPKLKSALIQVQHGPWMRAQRDKSNAYDALARLAGRRVLIATEKGRYLLNTRYGEWLDKAGRAVFTQGSQALARLSQLMAIRPYWRDTDTGEQAVAEIEAEAPARLSSDEENPTGNDAEGVAQPPANTPEKGLHNPQQRGDATPEKGLQDPLHGGDTTPTKGLHNPHGRPAKPENGAAPARTDSIFAAREREQQAEPMPEALVAFCRECCLLQPKEIGEVARFAATPADLVLAVAALERLAHAPKRPDNPVGFVRSLIERLRSGERASLPANARTFNEYRKQWERKQRLRDALNGEKRLTNGVSHAPAATDTPEHARTEARKLQSLAAQADAADESLIGEKLRQQAQRERSKAERLTRQHKLADCFAARPEPLQIGTLDEFRRAKIPAAPIRELQQWISAGRPAWRECGIPHIGEVLAQAEELAHKYLDPVVQTVTAHAP